MSSLNKKVTSDSFGRVFPTAIIDRVEISVTPGYTHVTGAKIDAYLSIKFTKPDHMQSGTVMDIIQYFVDSLYLYSYLVHDTYDGSGHVFKHGPTPDFVFDDLNNNKFSLGNWFTEQEKKYSDGTREQQFQKISISSLATGGNDSEIVMGTSFDANGKEIIEITNIKVSMNYLAVSPYFYRPGLLHTNLTYFCFVGLDNDEVFKTLETRSARDFVERHNTTENIYFGDISYYKILDQNVVPSKFYRAYTDNQGVPYAGPILQSINGKFFAADQFGFDDIKTIMMETISEFETDRTSDPVLEKNINSLEAIINASENTVGVLGELAIYRSTYPNKDAATLSGEFYNRFILTFQEIISSVQSQAELSTKLLYDSLVIDNRFGLLGDKYAQPEGSGLEQAKDIQSGVPYETPEDCFIPKKWFMLSRKAIYNDLALNNSSEFELVYGKSEDTGLTFADYQEYRNEEKIGDSRETLIQNYKDDGYSEEIATALAEEQIEYYYDSESMLNEMASRAMSDTSSTSGYLEEMDLVRDDRRDVMVRNLGTFIFDYEKALRTKSKISRIFDTAKIELLLRYKVPYELFYMTSTELSRNELRVDADDDVYSSEDERFIRAKLKCIHYHPNNAQYSAGEFGTGPIPYRNEIRYTGGSESGLLNNAAELSERLKYMNPTYTIGGQRRSVWKNCYLLPFNFDVANPTERLETLNSMENAGDFGFGSLSGQRFIDGYRVVAYKFQDIMDDDVAYYNTINPDSGDLPGRSEYIKRGNNLDEPRTCYSVVVNVNDRSHVLYESIINNFLEVYNEFLPFYRRCEELCAHNDITNNFNEWFVDALEEDYGKSKPWIAAAHTAVIISELTFKHGSAVNEDNFHTRILEIILKIAPETGNLPQLQRFMKEFNALMQWVAGPYVLDDLGLGPAEGAATPYTKYKSLFSYRDPETGEVTNSVPGSSYYLNISHTLQFYNEKPIWEPASGVLSPDEEAPEDLEISGPILFTLREAYDSVLSLYPDSNDNNVAYSSPGRPSSAGSLTGYHKIYSVTYGGSIASRERTIMQGRSQEAFPIIWYPVHENTLRWNFLNGFIDGQFADGEEGFTPDATVTMGLSEYTSAGYYDFEAHLPDLLNAHPDRLYRTEVYGAEEGDLYTGEAHSMFQYWIERIARRTTIDNELNSMGTGAKRRSAGSSIAARKNRRDISNIVRAIQLLVFRYLDTVLFEKTYRLSALQNVRDSRGYGDFNMVEDRGTFIEGMMELQYVLDGDPASPTAGEMIEHYVPEDDNVKTAAGKRIANHRAGLTMELMLDSIEDFYNDLAGRHRDRTPVEMQARYEEIIEVGKANYLAERSRSWYRLLDGPFVGGHPSFDGMELQAPFEYPKVVSARDQLRPLDEAIERNLIRDSDLRPGWIAGKDQIDRWLAANPDPDTNPDLVRIKAKEHVFYKGCNIVWTESLNANRIVGDVSAPQFHGAEMDRASADLREGVEDIQLVGLGYRDAIRFYADVTGYHDDLGE